MNKKEFKQYLQAMVNSMLEKVPGYNELDPTADLAEDYFSDDFLADSSEDIPEELIEELSHDLEKLEATYGFGDDWGNVHDWGDLIDWAGMKDFDGYGSSEPYDSDDTCEWEKPCYPKKPFHKPKFKKHFNDDKWLKCFIFTCLKLKLILCLLKNDKFGLREIKREIVLIEKAIFSPTFGLKEIKKELRRIECGIFSPTFGLPEIKSEVSNIESIVGDIADEIDSPTFGLQEIKSEVSQILTLVSNLNVIVPTLLLVDIKSEVSAIESAVFSTTFGLEEIKSEVSAIESAVFSKTFGLSEIKAEVSDILAIVTNLDFALFSDIKSEVSAIESAVFSETFGLEEIKSEVSTLLFEFEQFLTAQGPALNLTTGPFLATVGETVAEVKAFNATATFQSVTFEIFEIGTCPISLVDSVAFLDITPCCGSFALLTLNNLLLTDINAIINAEASASFGIFLYAASRATAVGPKVTEFFSADFLPLGTICV